MMASPAPSETENATPSELNIAAADSVQVKKRVLEDIATEAAAKKAKQDEAENTPEALAAKAALRKEYAEMMAEVKGWDLATLKKFAAALPKADFEAKQGKKAEMVETFGRTISLGLQGIKSATNRYSMFSRMTPTPGVRESLLEAFKSATADKKKKSMGGEARGLESQLAVLEKAQLVTLLMTLVDTKVVSATSVEQAIPAPDLLPVLKHLESQVAAIRKALPNSRYGSSTDSYGYKRCAGSVAACKKAFSEAAAGYRATKQWQVALTFAERALPIAHGMVDFPGNDSGKNNVLATLTKLRADATAKMA